MPLFSVIVPVYNASKSIERCVNSICESGQEDVEIILVDDCSTDDSHAKCLELGTRYSQVRVFKNQENKGVSHTRNVAIANSIGKYLLFVDSDDYVAKEYVPIFRVLIEKGVQFAVCGYKNHDELHAGMCTEVVWGQEETCNLREIIESLHKKTLLQQLWNKVFVAKKVKENNVRFDESINIGEDTRFILDYILQNDVREIACINQALYHYMRDNNGSLMYKVGYESVEEPLKNLRKMYQIMGLHTDEIEDRIEKERNNIVNGYAYLIMHNVGMKMREKKRLIYNLDQEKAAIVYRQQKKIYCKEHIAILLKKIGFIKKRGE